MSKSKIKKVVLAYSGGLDTSIILKWLQTEYQAEVVTFTADLGQGGELEPARKKAELMGIKSIYVEDVREEFIRDFVFPMFRANALYEGVYLLGTSIARPLIAKRLIEIAEETGAEAYVMGFGPPVSFAPYLEDLAQHLSHQYLLTFLAKPERTASFQSVKLRTEVLNVDLIAPDRVYVPVGR